MSTNQTRRSPAGTVRPRRADARRNIEAILDAAAATLNLRPDASIGDIARAAGVGRITLYGHFPSREALLEATAERVLDHGNAALDAAEIDRGPAREALARSIRSAWPVLDRSRALYAAVHTTAPARLRAAHDRFLGRIAALLERGRAEGTIRSDLPVEWLVATWYALMHGAAEEVEAGRLPADRAADVLEATLLAAFEVPRK
ncbi:MAG TPA: TetR/AcrR family transcriptional regulator [Candidatus Limnocylindrales bacterium]|nr:TetR/AcrR family transcriptional regulator [Candidatus Limnocylindrales bacterium]